MKKLLNTVLWIFAFSCLSDAAHAQYYRAWVSSNGTDGGTCQRGSPCQTFQYALTVLTRPGLLTCLDDVSSFLFTITQSVTIDCTAAAASVMHSYSGNAITINFDGFAGTDTRKVVTLRGLNIVGEGTGGPETGVGIQGEGTGSVVNIQDCQVEGFTGGIATGISDRRTNGQLNVVNTTMRDNTGSGITIASAGAGVIRASLSNVRVLNSANGIAVGAGAAVDLSNSFVFGNSLTGVTISGGGINIAETKLANNTIGIRQTGGAVNLSNSDISFNNTSVSGTVSSYSNNRFTSNGGGGTIIPIGSVTNPTGQH